MSSMSKLISVGRGDASVEEWPPGFVLLYEDHYDRMVRTAHLITGHDGAAEDVVQDCFLRIASKWERIEEPGAYLHRAVVNASRSWLRRNGRLRPLGAAPTEPVGPPRIDETWRALRILTPRRRAAVVLRFYEGLPDNEIADVLDCKPATVRSLIHRALRQLEEVL